MRSPATLLVASLVIVVAACGGTAATAAPSPGLPSLAAPASPGPSVAATSAGPSTASVAPSAVPSVASVAPSVATSVAPNETPTTETAAPTEAPTPAGTPIPVFGIADIQKSLSHLTSYQETFVTTGGTNDIRAKVVIVRAPTVMEELDVMEGSKSAQRVILIGKDDWIDPGTGKFQKNMEPAAALQAEFDVFDPGVFLASFNRTAQLQRVPPTGVETKNGVQAVHYHADASTALNPPNPTVPPGAVFDVWVSTDGSYLVAIEYSGVKESGKTISGSIELTNVNDSSLTVTAPS